MNDKIQEAIKLMKDVKIPEDRLEKLDKAIKLFEEAIQPEPEYKKGDWVLFDGHLFVFDKYDDDDFCYMKPPSREVTWLRSQHSIKHAKNIPNLRLRHDGSDVRPVDDEDATILLEFSNGKSRKGSIAEGWTWGYVTHYTIIPDSEEQ